MFLPRAPVHHDPVRIILSKFLHVHILWVLSGFPGSMTSLLSMWADPSKDARSGRHGLLRAASHVLTWCQGEGLANIERNTKTNTVKNTKTSIMKRTKTRTMTRTKTKIRTEGS